MTLNGAIMQLVEIWNHPMCPVIFKPALNKVIETISELEEPCTQVLGESCEIEQYAETCEECGFCDNISRQRAAAAAKEPVNPMYTWTAASIKEIEAVSSLVKNVTKQVQDAIAGRIEQLPPAQPEIIRCKDCKHLSNKDNEGGKCWHFNGFSKVVSYDDFCSRAERRTDERSD